MCIFSGGDLHTMFIISSMWNGQVFSVIGRRRTKNYYFIFFRFFGQLFRCVRIDPYTVTYNVLETLFLKSEFLVMLQH